MRRYIVLAAGLLFLSAAPAVAGMPTPLPADVLEAIERSELLRTQWMKAISFFSVVLLVSPLAVRGLWNSMAKEFPRMPRITYLKSLALITIWGLLFLVVLTMIAAAREMMTPGVWQRQGLLYKLPPDQTPTVPGRR